MDIDLFMALLNPSMMVVLGSTFFVLWLYQRRRRLLLLFSGGYACLAAGFLLQFFMLPGGFDFTKFVSATCFTLGVCTMAGGIVALYGRRPPYVALAVLAGGGMAALCWFLFVEPDVVWRIYSLNFAFGGVCLVLVNELRRVRGAPTARIFLALGLAYTPSVTRIVRGTVLSLREKEFIESSRVLGNSELYTMVRHVLPNCVAPLTVLATSMFGWVILAESALSFLGLGVPPPAPTWGNMLAAARPFMAQASYLSILPGLAIALALLGINLLGDAVRDRFDPRMRGVQ